MLEQQRRSVASAVAQWRGKVIKTEEGEGQEIWPATAAWFLGPKVLTFSILSYEYQALN